MLRNRCFGWLGGAVLLLSGCGSEGGPATVSSTAGSGGQGPCADPAAEACACPAGFALDPASGGCRDVSPTEDCPPGTRPSLGSVECVAVGWSAACPDGFEPDSSGWGCRDVQPEAPCAAGTLEQLGATSCQAMCDPAAAFPPPEATIFVDDDLAPGDEDATHFATIAGALAAAPAGAVIAIESGTYTEALLPSKAVRLAGRCAADTVIASPGGDAPGIDLAGGGDVAISGVTLSGHRFAILAFDATVSIEACSLAGNRAGGVAAAGGELLVTRSRIADSVEDGAWVGAALVLQDGVTFEAHEAALVSNRGVGVSISGEGTTAVLERTIVRGTRTAGGIFGKGVQVRGGAALELVESALVENHAANLSVFAADGEPAGHATVTSSVLRDALHDDAGNHGNGIEVTAGGSAEIESSAITGSAGWAALVLEAGSSLEASGVVVHGPSTDVDGRRDLGVLVSDGASVELTDVAVVGRRAGLAVQDTGSKIVARATLVRDTRRVETDLVDPAAGIGVHASFGGAVDLDDSAVVANRALGVFAGALGIDGTPARVGLTGSLVVDTQATAAGLFGRGVEVVEGGIAVLDRSVVAGNGEVGISAGGAGTRVELARTIVRDTAVSDAGGFGHGLVAIGGASADLSGAWIQDSSGIGIVFAGAGARVDRGVVALNQVGIHVQGGSVLNELAELPAAPAPLQVLVSTATRFVDNATRVGSGEVPLPAPLE